VVVVQADRGLPAVAETYFGGAAAHSGVSEARGPLDYPKIFYVSLWPLDGREAVDACARGED